MKYKIITTVQLEVVNETALKNMLDTIDTFVSNNNGTHKDLIRSVPEEEEQPVE